MVSLSNAVIEPRIISNNFPIGLAVSKFMFKMRSLTSLIVSVSTILIPHTPRQAEVFGRHAFDAS
jgi:hypothetical protein